MLDENRFTLMAPKIRTRTVIRLRGTLLRSCGPANQKAFSMQQVQSGPTS